ncbi:peptidyl-tRNA hydrolase [Ligilactobacillus acidipiscis DSM 15836]|uniref:Peptidyl-tRNA hydrolase n=1 Tax=Ligilactobacillus acidipiscis DSM 15836 TaxID=1423716 RepID=A0ABR5PJ13_9LACO|nr:aminoacyl-tRNA hydrolase [Ligilactobacillus acidipiscis]KRM26092.1 peptidyl-tRNA hydrolase [Ligilactobacillus acidipiscis DSM 15836]GAW63640.1 peptidyl-tRNA hydrolase [Ligilactobacillus acidipiscis]GEN21546.1 peptidyl-tRNA hydrolase [Ligilactobacillus acidipiscis]
MKMIVGLGNIGKKYENTRHNVGFSVVEELANRYNVDFNKEKCEALIATAFISNEKVLLVKPTTFMNDSGRAVGPLLDYFKIEVEDLIIIHDDMDLQLGRIRLRQKGSAGGHNGIKSVIAHVHTQAFKRVKVGIDHPQQMSVVNWVLSRFSVTEQALMKDAVTQACDAVEYWLAGNTFMNTMNRFN